VDEFGALFPDECAAAAAFLARLAWGARFLPIWRAICA
jgi:hypothetical protein